MIGYIVRRLLLAIVTIWAISVVTFAIIQLPPGDFVDAYIAQAVRLRLGGHQEEAEAMREPTASTSRSGPVRQVDCARLARRFRRLARVEPAGHRGDRRPAWLTIVISIGALIVTWAIALPIGIYSAVRQYSIGDYIFTFVGFIGLAVPNFLLALIVMYLASACSARTSAACSRPSTSWRPGAWGKVWDLAKHLPLPADPGARRHRAADPHHARQPARRAAPALCGHGARQGPVRVPGDPEIPGARALNPFASTIGYLLPFVVSGSIIVSLVLSLPTVGPLLLRRWSQDMFLAGTIVLLLAC